MIYLQKNSAWFVDAFDVVGGLSVLRFNFLLGVE
jgi:hypothetical protein